MTTFLRALARPLITSAAALLLALAAPACARAEAADLTPLCNFRVDRNPSGFLAAVRDDDYETLWRASDARHGYVELEAPEECGGVYVKWMHVGVAWEVQGELDGEWETLAHSETGYLCDYLPVPKGHKRLRLRASERGKSAPEMQIVELRVYGRGEPPADVQRWQPPLDKADLLLIHAHPDDEVCLWAACCPITRASAATPCRC